MSCSSNYIFFLSPTLSLILHCHLLIYHCSFSFKHHHFSRLAIPCCLPLIALIQLISRYLLARPYNLTKAKCWHWKKFLMSWVQKRITTNGNCEQRTAFVNKTHLANWFRSDGLSRSVFWKRGSAASAVQFSWWTGKTSRLESLSPLRH